MSKEKIRKTNKRYYKTIKNYTFSEVFTRELLKRLNDNSKIIIVGTPRRRSLITQKTLDEMSKQHNINPSVCQNIGEKIRGQRPTFIEFDSIMHTEPDTNGNQKCCGDCIHFGVLPEAINGKSMGCKTSYLEAKWGSANTPACKNDFVQKDNFVDVYYE